MNYSLSNALYAILGVLLLSLSSFGQDARLHDLSVMQINGHGSRSEDSTNDNGRIISDYLIDEPFRYPEDLGPLGPGPFQPEVDVQDDWNYEGPVVLGGIVVGNPADLPTDPKNSLVGVSNGFIWVGAMDALVDGLIDIEDYISKGGGDLQTDVVMLAGRTGGWFEDERLVLIIPQDDPTIDPNTGLLILPWAKKGYLDQEKVLPTDDDRSDGARGK